MVKLIDGLEAARPTSSACATRRTGAPTRCTPTPAGLEALAELLPRMERAEAELTAAARARRARRG